MEERIHRGGRWGSRRIVSGGWDVEKRINRGWGRLKGNVETYGVMDGWIDVSMRWPGCRTD